MATVAPKCVLVVMAGGSGTRFWPKSTAECPKQFLDFGLGRTLLESTIDRVLSNKVRFLKVIVVTTTKLEALAKKTLLQTKQPTEWPPLEILVEPEGRNTAPCVFWAAKRVEKMDPAATMVVMPADQLVQDKVKFLETLQQAVNTVQGTAYLATIGVQPTRPETGFGYLKVGARLPGEQGYQVERFVEKPDLATAKQYLASKNYWWNGGMFIFQVGAILDSFRKCLPEYEEVWLKSKGELERYYTQLKAISLDHGVFEKSENVVTFPLQSDWDDLGSWSAMENFCKITQKTANKDFTNFVLSGHLRAIDSTGNIVDAPGKTVSLLGVHDLVIVESNGNILVTPKSRSQEVKKLIEP